MISDRDADRILRSWFQEGTAQLPDRVLDTVLDGLPRVHQRRRTWLPIELSARSRLVLQLAILAAVLVTLLGGLLLAGGRIFPRPPMALPGGEEVPLEAGRYVVQGDFPVRIALDIPSGWLVSEFTGNWARIARDEAGHRTELLFTFVDALYLDPCHPELGIREDMGRGFEELAGALAALPGVGASGVGQATIDGRAARTVSMTGPDSTADCTPFEPTTPIWGMPELFGLEGGAHHRFWVLNMEPRLVIAARDAGADSRGAAELDAIIASIDFDAEPVVEPTDGPEPSRDPPWPTIASSGPVPAGNGVLKVKLYTFDADGRQVPLEGFYDAAFAVPPGWFGTPRGLSSEPGEGATATFAVWSLARVYIDPCQWQTSGIVDPPLLRSADGIGLGLSAWWPSEPVASGDAQPARWAPRASTPIHFPWLGSARELTLDIPADLDLDACDDGEYRLWEDPTGEPRLGKPGEHFLIWVGTTDPGLPVVETSHLPEAAQADVDALDEMLHSLFIGRF